MGECRQASPGHQQPAHECEIGNRFAGRTQSVHLIEAGEAVFVLGRQLFIFSRHGFPLSVVSADWCDSDWARA